MCIAVETVSAPATSFGPTRKSLHTFEATKEGLFGVKKVFFLSLNRLTESHGSLDGFMGRNF